MVRRSPRWHAPKPHFDHAEMFVSAARWIALGSGILDAYRKSTGLVFRPVHTDEARDSLAKAVAEVVATIPPYSQYDWARSMEHTGKAATCAFVGQWWSCTLTSVPPPLAPGDEYFARQTVALIVEQHREPVPDARG